MNVLTSRKPLEEHGPQTRVQEEALVTDSRAGVTPSQMVERKLIGLLRGTPLPVSQLLTGARRRLVS
jgi:hypothetical protein